MGMSEDYEGGCVTPIRSDISTFSRGTDGQTGTYEPTEPSCILRRRLVFVFSKHVIFMACFSSGSFQRMTMSSVRFCRENSKAGLPLAKLGESLLFS
jgi:hypothetical protein